MSNVIDQKVVEMRFDNKQFETMFKPVYRHSTG